MSIKADRIREETIATLEHLAGYSRTALELIAFEANRQVELLTAERDALKAELALLQERLG